LCGFEPYLIKPQTTDYSDKGKLQDLIFSMIDGKKTAVDIRTELDLTHRELSYCIEKLIKFKRIKEVGWKGNTKVYSQVKPQT
jgi:predicted HTH transcriptional regulator